MDLDSVSKNVLDSALTFTGLGLSVAGTAVGYAAEVLKDFEHELKSAGERFTATSSSSETPAAGAPAAAPAPDPTAAAK